MLVAHLLNAYMLCTHSVQQHVELTADASTTGVLHDRRCGVYNTYIDCLFDMQLGSQHRVWGNRILVGLLMLFMALLYAGIWVYLQYYA